MTKVIYQPKGRAREYAPLAVNLWTGCSHGCDYCYVPGVLRVDRPRFHQTVTPRKGVLDALEREAPGYRGTKDRVLLCFTCDPYPPEEQTNLVTRRALEIFRRYKVPVAVLTKAGNLAQRDMDLLEGMDAHFGVSLSWADDAKRTIWEPHAGSVEQRITNLVVAKSMGIHTWMSVEPVIDPDQAFMAIENTLAVVDTYKVGKWNHDTRARAIDWAAFGFDVRGLLEGAGKDYMIKKDLAECMDRR